MLNPAASNPNKVVEDNKTMTRASAGFYTAEYDYSTLASQGYKLAAVFAESGTSAYHLIPYIHDSANHSIKVQTIESGLATGLTINAHFTMLFVQ